MNQAQGTIICRGNKHTNFPMTDQQAKNKHIIDDEMVEEQKQTEVKKESRTTWRLRQLKYMLPNIPTTENTTLEKIRRAHFAKLDREESEVQGPQIDPM